jgi:hypothetical protein
VAKAKTQPEMLTERFGGVWVVNPQGGHYCNSSPLFSIRRRRPGRDRDGNPTGPFEHCLWHRHQGFCCWVMFGKDYIWKPMRYEHVAAQEEDQA